MAEERFRECMNKLLVPSLVLGSALAIEGASGPEFAAVRSAADCIACEGSTDYESPSMHVVTHGRYELARSHLASVLGWSGNGGGAGHITAFGWHRQLVGLPSMLEIPRAGSGGLITFEPS